MSPLFIYTQMIDKNKIPNHVAIIMDGNGRWAQKKGLPKIEGHRAGATAVKGVIAVCLELGIKILSLYTFSTENWKRPQKEVQALMKLLEQFLKKHYQELQENEIRLLISGDITALAVSLQKQIGQVVKETEKNSRLLLNLALNYGGREEITQAAKTIALKVKRKELAIEDIDQETFSSCLYTKDLPDPDLLIRTSHEQRISNFFLWQISYAELYFTTTLWPDFKKDNFLQAISDYQKRKRRFGG